MEILQSLFAVFLGSIFAIILIASVWANYIWRQGETVPEPLRIPSRGSPRMKIEEEIHKLVSSTKLTADEIIENLCHINYDDLWATLLEMLSRGRLIEAQDSTSGYYLYTVPAA